MLRDGQHQGRFYEAETHSLFKTLKESTIKVPGIRAELRLSGLRRFQNQLPIKVSQPARSS